MTVRDERALRVLARDNDEVDDGWLCDKGRFAYQSFHVDERITEPLLRDGGQLRPVSWERALARGRRRPARAPARATGAIAGGGATNEEGLLLARLMREALGSPAPGLAPRAARCRSTCTARSARPRCRRGVATSSSPHAVLVLDAEPVNDAPILDLRLRKGVRRHGLQLAVAIAAAELARRARRAVACASRPAPAPAFAAALAAALAERRRASSTASPPTRAPSRRRCASWRRCCAAPARPRRRRQAPARGRDPVGRAPDRRAPTARPARTALLRDRRPRSASAGIDGAGLLEIPARANGRGLREAGVLPNAGPGLRRAAGASGRDAHAIAEGLAAGELQRALPAALRPAARPARRASCGGARWPARAPSSRTPSFLTEGIREHADVVFPAEAYAEKEGTVVHPDGRLQRLRPAIARPGEVRAGWRVLAELALRARARPRRAERRDGLAAAVRGGPVLRRPHARGDRRPRRALAGARPRPTLPGAGAAGEAARRAGRARRRPATPARRREVAGFRSVWDAPEVEYSPALEFLLPDGAARDARRRCRASRPRAWERT